MVVGTRLKRAGMRWTIRGSNAIIALRCSRLSGPLSGFLGAPGRREKRSVTTSHHFLVVRPSPVNINQMPSEVQCPDGEHVAELFRLQFPAGQMVAAQAATW